MSNQIEIPAEVQEMIQQETLDHWNPEEKAVLLNKVESIVRRAIELMQSKWVLCSERLPEKDGTYLVMCLDNSGYFYVSLHYDFGRWQQSYASIIAWLDNVPEFENKNK